MERLFIRHIFLYALLLIICTSCDKKEEENNPSSTAKGFGSSIERPEGAPFQLPAGVTLISNPIGYNKLVTTYCNGKTAEDAIGFGFLVQLCIGFRNSTDQPVTINLPAGLIFISLKTETQNGILVVDETIVVPAKADLVLPIHLCCLNLERFPSEEGDIYEIGPVTNFTPMVQWLNRLRKKRINEEDHVFVVQKMVRNLTEIHQLDEKDEDEMAALPNR